MSVITMENHELIVKSRVFRNRIYASIFAFFAGIGFILYLQGAQRDKADAQMRDTFIERQAGKNPEDKTRVREALGKAEEEKAVLGVELQKATGKTPMELQKQALRELARRGKK